MRIWLVFPMLAAVLAISCPALAQHPALITTVSARSGDAYMTADLRGLACGDTINLAELLNKPMSAETNYDIVVDDLDYDGCFDDFLILGPDPCQGGDDTLTWYTLGAIDCNLSYQDTLLQSNPATKRLLAVATGDLDNDASCDVLVLERPVGQTYPTLEYYEFDPNYGQLTDRGPISLTPCYKLVTMTLGDWGGDGNINLITVEEEQAEPNNIHICCYDPNTDLVFAFDFAFEVETFVKPNHNFKSLSFGRVDHGEEPGLIVVDSILNDSNTAIEQWVFIDGELVMTESLLVTNPQQEKLLGGAFIPNHEDYKLYCYTQYQPYAAGDLNSDCWVNFKDLAITANQWLSYGN